MTYVFEVTPTMIVILFGCGLVFPLFFPGNLKKLIKFLSMLFIGIEDRTLESIVSRHSNIRRLTVGRKWSNKRYYRH